MDTLHATEPAYSLGITPIQALTGTYDFTLTKTSTWNGDTAAFWGDTSKLKKAAGRIWCTFINRTNGALADSQIYWCLGDFGTPIRLSDSSTIDITTSTAGRLYVMLGYKPAPPPDSSRPGNAVWDWEEHTCGDGRYNGNLTRVDAFGVPLSIRLHCTDGYDAARGEIYDVFYEPRQAIFDEYANEVPYQFTDQATIQAPYRIPDPGMTPNFSTGGLYAHYWDAYQAICRGDCGTILRHQRSGKIFRPAPAYAGIAFGTAAERQVPLSESAVQLLFVFLSPACHCSGFNTGFPMTTVTASRRSLRTAMPNG